MYKFLIVDDEHLIRKGTLKKIASLNLPIECIAEATNGKEAIELLLTNKIDFIITDMDMPELDGMELIDYINRNYPSLPIIIISGYKKFEYLQKSIQVKAINYILKPFSKKDIGDSLIETIHTLQERDNNQDNENEIIISALLGNMTNFATQILDKIFSKYQKDQIFLILSKKDLSYSSINIIKRLELKQSNFFVYFIYGKQSVDTLINCHSVKDGILVIGDAMIETNRIHDYFVKCIDTINFQY